MKTARMLLVSLWITDYGTSVLMLAYCYLSDIITPLRR